MTKRLLTVLLCISIIFATSCTKKEVKETSTQSLVPVKIIKLQEEARPMTLDYVGIVNSKNLINLSFKTSGRIEKIHVNKGQKVKAGEPLVALEREDLKFALDAAKAQLDGAEAQYEKAINGSSAEDKATADINVSKAQNGYDYAKEIFNKMDTLYGEGAISKNDYDKAKLELDMREAELSQAKELKKQLDNGTRQEDKKALLSQVEQARVNYEQKLNLYDSGSIVSNFDGQVIDILFEEGEMVSAGYPVIAVGGNYQVMTVGLNQGDIGKVELETIARIKIGEVEASGKLINISTVPNSQTRTYEVEIELDKHAFSLGSIGDVELIIGKDQGIWVPLTSILSNADDYVFIVEEEKAIRKSIVIEDSKGSEVKVRGLEAGDLLIIEGMKRVREGDKVLIKE